jgi:4-amino-4-deoxy-L-arabinose transferase-like glycosyltransferase
MAYLSLLFWLFVLILTVYESGRLLFSREAGLLAAAVVSFYPITFGLTRSFYPDLPALALTSLTWMAYLRSDGLRKPGWTAFFGLAAGMAQMAKWTSIFFWIGPVAASFLTHTLPQVLPEEPQREQAGKFMRRWLTGYVIAFLMFAFLMDILLDRIGAYTSGYIPRLFTATALFHLMLAAGVLLLPAAWRFRQAWSGARTARLVPGRRLFHLILAAVVALVVCLPWYIPHASYLLNSTFSEATSSAARRGMPSIASAHSLLRYLFLLENHQIHLLFFIAFIAAAVFCRRKHRPAQFPLLFGFAIGYLALTCVRLKDPRFSMPYLYLAALATAGGVFSWKNIILRRATTGTLVAAGLLQYLLITFGLGINPGNYFLHTRWGEIALFKAHGYGSYEKISQKWKVKAALGWLGTQVPKDHLSRVFTLVNHPAVHFEVFNLYADIQNLPLLFEYPLRDASGRGAATHVRLGDYLLIKRGGDQGPAFSLEGLPHDLQWLLKPSGKEPFTFEIQKQFELPDGSKMELWQKVQPDHKPIPVGIQMEALGRVWTCKAGPPLVAGQGQKSSLTIQAELDPRLAGDYHLFIHLYSPLNRFRGSFGGPFPALNESGPSTLTFPIDTSLATDWGLGQLAIGVWDPETGERLPLSDLQTGEEIGDILYLNAFLYILPENAP